MSSLVVGLVSCSVCANTRRLQCAIWAATLRNASSWRYAAAFIGSSGCWVSCHCRACVTAPLMVTSRISGSLKRWLAAWCVWLCVGQPSCCCRVSAGEQPTSGLLPAWRGHVVQVLSILRGDVVSWAAGFFLGMWSCLQASHRATLVRNGSCSLRSWISRFCSWARTHAGRLAEWQRGSFTVSWSSWMCARLSVSPSTRARCWMGFGK